MFSVILGINGLAFSANQTSFDSAQNQVTNSRTKLIQMCAYISTQPIAGNEVYNDDTVKKYLNMSDEEFLTAIRKNLQTVISKKEAGAQIFWDKEFVNELKTFDPNLSNQLEQQLVKVAKSEKSPSPSERIYIPGTNYHDFPFYGYSFSGLCI